MIRSLCWLPLLLALLGRPVGAQDSMTLAGTCRRADGAPVAKAKVDLIRKDYHRFRDVLERSAITDEQGRFRFEGIPALGAADWGYTFWFVRAGAADLADAVASVRAGGVDPTGLEVVLHAPAKVEGRVTDDDGAPIANATVWVTRYGVWAPMRRAGGDGTHSYAWGLLSEPLPQWMARTGDDGAFVLENLPEGIECELRVSHPTFARKRVELTAPARPDVILGPGGSFTGRIVRADTGEPVEGAIAQIQGIDQSGWDSVPTARDGSFRIESLPPDRYNLWAQVEGWTVVAHAGLVVRGGEIVETKDLELVRGGFVEGVVKGPDGKPVRPGVTADVGLYGPSRPRPGAAIETAEVGDDGRFRIRVAPGSNYVYLRVGVGWSAVAPESHTVDVEEGQTVTVEFEVAPAK